MIKINISCQCSHNCMSCGELIMPSVPYQMQYGSKDELESGHNGRLICGECATRSIELPWLQQSLEK